VAALVVVGIRSVRTILRRERERERERLVRCSCLWLCVGCGCSCVCMVTQGIEDKGLKSKD